ncbi:MAG: thrombospondin type 3 repeat-containing protein [Patescibacteria group bacterium]
MKIGKNIVFIFIAILLVGGSFVFAEYRNKNAENVYVAPEVVNSIDRSAQDLDTDGDGMKDWEEILIGTNPKDPKSKENRTPSASIIKDLTQKTAEKIEPIDALSREFFARYMELRQLGISGDKYNQQDLIQKTIDSIPPTQAKPYLISEIKIKTDSSKEAVKQYGNEMTAVFKKYVVGSRNEGLIVKDALQKGNPDILKELDPVIESYKNIVNGLLKIETPKSMEVLHLDLVNAINSVLFMMQSFRKATIDPLAGIEAAGQWPIIEKGFFDALRAVQSYLIYLGITYAETDPAFYFVYPK